MGQALVCFGGCGTTWNPVPAADMAPAAPTTLRQIVRAAIHDALVRNRGNKFRTALELGIGRTSLYRKLNAPAPESESVCVEREYPVPLVLSALNDADLYSWLKNAVDPRRRAELFVAAIAEAAFLADIENYPVLRPALRFFQKRYPEYDVPKAKE